MDIKILLFIQNHIRNTVFNTFFTFITNQKLLLCILFLILFILFLHKDTRRLAQKTLIAFVLCFVLFTLLKLVFQRPRPFDTYSQLIPLIKKPQDYSFPSGHTACVFVCAFMIHDKLPKKYTIPVLIFAILVAFSRLYVGVHYPTDILAGILLAYLIYRCTKKMMPE